MKIETRRDSYGCFFLSLFWLNIRKYSKVSEKWYSDEYGRVILHPRDEHLEIILLSSLNGGDCIILHLVTMTSYILAPTLSTARKYIFDYCDTEQICLHHWHSHVAGTILFPVDNTCSGQSTCGIINVAEILRFDTWGQVLGSLDVKLWRYYEPAFFFSGWYHIRWHPHCGLQENISFALFGDYDFEQIRLHHCHVWPTQCEHQ